MKMVENVYVLEWMLLITDILSLLIFYHWAYKKESYVYKFLENFWKKTFDYDELNWSFIFLFSDLYIWGKRKIIFFGETMSMTWLCKIMGNLRTQKELCGYLYAIVWIIVKGGQCIATKGYCMNFMWVYKIVVLKYKI